MAGSDGMTLIAIDGPAGAGKTTLAARFFKEFSTSKTVAVIQMDDLYDGWEDALDYRLTSRLTGIVEAFAAHSRFSIPIFNWTTLSFDSSQNIDPSEILIIEGVGAGQKAVRDAGAIVYWLDIEAEVGLARVLERDGYEIESQMRQWQLDQDAHFLRDNTRANANHILTS